MWPLKARKWPFKIVCYASMEKKFQIYFSGLRDCLVTIIRKVNVNNGSTMLLVVTKLKSGDHGQSVSGSRENRSTAIIRPLVGIGSTKTLWLESGH